MPLKAFGVACLAGLAALSFPAVAHGPGKPATDQRPLPTSARAPAAIVDAFHAALARGDTKAAAALLAEDAVIFEEGGVERSKAEYAEHHLPADAEFSKAATTTLSHRTGRSDGTFAWIASEGRTTGTFRGRAVNRVTTETMLLRRVGRTWKIVHIHWSSREPR